MTEDQTLESEKCIPALPLSERPGTHLGVCLSLVVLIRALWIQHRDQESQFPTFLLKQTF